MYDDLTSRLSPAIYLTAVNANRYRPIIRYFYLQAEKMNKWLTPEDVYEAVRHTEGLEEYTLSQCENDLEVLANFESLAYRQEISHVKSIKEYLKKSYIYSITEITRLIEKAIIQSQSLNLERTSLNSRFVILFKEYVSEIVHMSSYDFDELIRLRISTSKTRNEAKKLKGLEQRLNDVTVWWENMLRAFESIDENYAHTLGLIEDITRDKKLDTTKFNEHKELLMDKLRYFISDLQVYSGEIKKIIKTTPEDMVNKALQNVILGYEIQTKYRDITREDIEIDIKEKWSNISTWFFSSYGRESGCEKVKEKTFRILSKLTEVASRLSEQLTTRAGRELVYKKVLDLFLNVDEDDIGECHKLSAFVFGVSHSKHLVSGGSIGNITKLNEDVFESKPILKCFPRRKDKEITKTKKRYLQDDSELKKQLIREEYIENKKVEEEIFSYIIDGEIDLAELPVISDRALKILLDWIQRANISERDGEVGIIKTEYGLTFKLIEPLANKRCDVMCYSGTLDSPAYKFKLIGGLKGD